MSYNVVTCADSSNEDVVLEENLLRIKSKITLCVTKNEVNSLPKMIPVYYINNTNNVQVHGFRNLYLKRFCGVTCLYAIALNLLMQNKNKFLCPEDLTFRGKFDLCLDTVNETMIDQAAKLRRGTENNIKHNLNPGKCKIFLSSDGEIACAVINNTLSKLFDVTVFHRQCSINFKGPKMNVNCNLEKDEILQTILHYDQGYCLLEGISADGLRDRNLIDYTCEKYAPRNDLPAHILPFFKACVNNESKTFVLWDTFTSDDKPIELRPICDLKDLQTYLLYTYNFITVYGIEQKEKEISDTQKKHLYRRELEELELQQVEIKKRKQELKNKLSIFKKRNTEISN